ncbi:MAG: hypothetical protein ISP49_03415 [Reyranella sp.]|nr:hypothetical protein [Reyranella sp.]
MTYHAAAHAAAIVTIFAIVSLISIPTGIEPINPGMIEESSSRNDRSHPTSKFGWREGSDVYASRHQLGILRGTLVLTLIRHKPKGRSPRKQQHTYRRHKQHTKRLGEAVHHRARQATKVPLRVRQKGHYLCSRRSKEINHIQ